MVRKFIILAVLVTVSQISPTTQYQIDDDFDPEVHQLTQNQIAAIENDWRASSDAVREATSIIYSILEQQLIKFSKKEEGAGKPCRIVNRVAQRRIYNIYKVELDSYLNATQTAQPEAHSTIRNVRYASYNALLHLVRNITSAMELINHRTSPHIWTEIDNYENLSAYTGTHMLKIIYVPILNGRDSSSTVGAEIKQARKESVAIGEKVTNSIYRGIRFVLGRVAGKHHYKDSDCSSLENLKIASLNAIHDMVASVFRAIDIILNADDELETNIDPDL